MAAPLFATLPQRTLPLALKLAPLPALTMALSPVDEKDLLPCIMITPSTPVHERDLEIHYFTPEKPRAGFFASIRDLISWTPSRRIVLPDSQENYQYGSATAPAKKWSAMKRFRAFLLLTATMFVALHVFALSHGDDGLYDVFRGGYSGSAPAYPAALVWEWETAPTTSESTPAASSVVDDVLATTTTTTTMVASADSTPLSIEVMESDL